MQGINFGMDGPQMTGWWVNPKTGDKFKAVDTYFEDNNLIIKAADGRMFNYKQVQNYVQTGEPESIPVDKKQSSSNKSNSLPPEVMSELESTDNKNEGLLIPGDNIYGIPQKQSPSAELGNINSNEHPKPINDFGIIDRALNSKKSPKASAKIAWDGFPQREVEMLVDVMNISIDDVVEYYINNINVNDLVDEVKSQIRKYIKDHYTASAPAKTTTKKTVKK